MREWKCSETWCLAPLTGQHFWEGPRNSCHKHLPELTAGIKEKSRKLCLYMQFNPQSFHLAVKHRYICFAFYVAPVFHLAVCMVNWAFLLPVYNDSFLYFSLQPTVSFLDKRTDYADVWSSNPTLFSRNLSSVPNSLFSFFLITSCPVQTCLRVAEFHERTQNLLEHLKAASKISILYFLSSHVFFLGLANFLWHKDSLYPDVCS